MKYCDHRIWTLITKALTGEANSHELSELQEWLNKYSENRAFFSELKKSWETDPEGPSIPTYLFDYQSGLSKLRDKLNEEKSNPRRITYSLKESNRYRATAHKIVASMVILVMALSVYMAFQLWEKPESITSYATSSNEQRIISLPDGSTVRLNRNSKIEFKKDLAGETRKIRLHGEAFFDVSRNPERPFVINAGTAVIRVLGTSFNVKKGRKVMVAVEEGLVGLSRNNKDSRKEVSVSAGQLGLLSDNGDEIVVERSDIENYMGWKNGYLTFDSMTFDRVTTQLERIYGIDSVLRDASIKSLQLTVYTERTQLEEVLKTIALAMNLNYEKRGKKITWSKKQESETTRTIDNFN